MITTALTEMFGLQHPIILGPMGGVSGGEVVDLIKSVDSASAIVARISAEGQAQLRAGAKLAR